MILEIPRYFERHLERGGSPVAVRVAANAINGTKGGLGVSYLSSVVSDFCAAHAAGQSGVRVAERYLFNPRLDYKYFMVPALMVMLLTYHVRLSAHIEYCQ